MGSVNWVGLGTLCGREVRRFSKVFIQTLLAPMVTTLLFLAIFALALGRLSQTVGGVPFMEFLAPGLIMMAIIQNAFANTSSSMVTSKMQGNIVDTLMAPLTAHELTLGYAFGGVARGIAVGTVVGLAMSVFVPIHLHHLGFIVFHAVAASLMLALMGLMAGIWADKFDQMSAVTNFVVTPLSFLSGTFYSIQRLPETFQALAHVNPFFYMIDGFRYGFIGSSDADPLTGVWVLAALDAVLWVCCYRMIATGYKLKP